LISDLVNVVAAHVRELEFLANCIFFKSKRTLSREMERVHFELLPAFLTVLAAERAGCPRE
jgi:hypothetical protein